MKELFYRLVKILKANAIWNIILGERSNGKSYAVKEYALEESWKGNGLLVYLRRWDIDIKKSKVEKYFSDAPVKKITKGKCDCISYYSGDLYFSRRNPDGSVERIIICGYAVGLSGQSHNKSLNFVDVENVIFEEFVTDDVYLDDEVEMLFNMISTVARRRTIKVWMIGNTISRLCPYFSEWELVNIPKQKTDTIDIYEKTTSTGDVVKIAVEKCADIVTNKMFFGEKSNVIKGEWNAKTYPRLPREYKKYKQMYKLLIKKYNMEYMVEVLQYNHEYVLFVHPNTNKRFDGRIIQNEYDIRPLVTSNLTRLTKGDIMIIELLNNNKICYSDNLTGTEFHTLLKGGEII